MANGYISEVTLPDNTTYTLHDDLTRVYDDNDGESHNMLTLLSNTASDTSLFTIGTGADVATAINQYKLFYAITTAAPPSLIFSSHPDINTTQYLLQISPNELISYNDISIKNPSINLGLSNNGGNNLNKITMKDENEYIYASIAGQVIAESGDTQLHLKAGNYSSNTQFEQGITIQLNKSNICNYIVDNPDNFRLAIDAASVSHSHGSMYLSVTDGEMQGNIHFRILDYEKGDAISATATESLASYGIEFDDSTGTTISGDRLGFINCQITTAGAVQTLLWAYKNVTGDLTDPGYFGAGYDVALDLARTYTNCKVYGAVWNDYAEYRAGNIIDGGYCVTETKDGIMEKTTERLMPGCKITSDTFGFAIGETETAKTPIAVCGRVLVYPYRNIEEYQLGDALCSAPGGTVDIMTREEIREYPERIIGTVSEIPKYDIWYAGGQQNQTAVPVNGRIWIYVK